MTTRLYEHFSTHHYILPPSHHQKTQVFQYLQHLWNNSCRQMHPVKLNVETQMINLTLIMITLFKIKLEIFCSKFSIISTSFYQYLTLPDN